MDRAEGSWVLAGYHDLSTFSLGFSTISRIIRVSLSKKNNSRRIILNFNFKPFFKKKHESYEAASLRNDIALLKLKNPVTFSNNIQPICLPSAQATVGQSVVLTGWVYQLKYKE